MRSLYIQRVGRKGRQDKATQEEAPNKKQDNQSSAIWCAGQVNIVFGHGDDE
jgi:hypothetical protein